MPERHNAFFEQFTCAITRVRTTQKVIALTFDDGPDAKTTPRVLEILARFDARATFFMLGCQARRHPEMVAKVRQAEHAIGIHGDSHIPFPHLGTGSRIRQILAVRKACGWPTPRLFRPPFGQLHFCMRMELFLTGHAVVCWDIDSEDWRDLDQESVARRVGSRIAPGSMVLFHDHLSHVLEPSHADRSAMLGALQILLNTYSGEYSFVTIPELLRAGTPVRESWYRVSGSDFLDSFQCPDDQ